MAAAYASSLPVTSRGGRCTLAQRRGARRRWWQELITGVVALLTFLVLLPVPASADPNANTDDRSVMVAVKSWFYTGIDQLTVASDLRRHPRPSDAHLGEPFRHAPRPSR